MKLEPDHSKAQGSCSTCCLEDLLCGALESRALFGGRRMRWGKIHFVYIYRLTTDIQRTVVENRLSMISHVIFAK